MKYSIVKSTTGVLIAQTDDRYVASTIEYINGDYITVLTDTIELQAGRIGHVGWHPEDKEYQKAIPQLAESLYRQRLKSVLFHDMMNMDEKTA